jgi:hypothetical protein
METCYRGVIIAHDTVCHGFRRRMARARMAVIAASSCCWESAKTCNSPHSLFFLSQPLPSLSKRASLPHPESRIALRLVLLNGIAFKALLH